MYDSLLKPIMDPIESPLDPFVDLFSFTEDQPLSDILDLLAPAIPILGMAKSYIDLASDTSKFIDKTNETGGWLIFGDYDLTPMVAGDDEGAEDLGSALDEGGFSQSGGSPLLEENQFGVFGNTNYGISAEFNLITAADDATGTYIIFGEGGSEQIDIPGGNVIFINDDDFGMRDTFQQKFANGGLSEQAILDLIGINADGTVNTSAAANYDVNGNTYNFSQLIDNYTEKTQLSASDDPETVNIGAGNSTILTGGGNDSITVAGGGLRVRSCCLGPWR